MAEMIKLTPAELQNQAAEMRTLEEDFATLFTSVSAELKKINGNWSPNLSNNFEGKINSAQRSFKKITQELANGAKVAQNCAVTFESVDSQLAKLYGGQVSNGPAAVTADNRGGMPGVFDKVTDAGAKLWDMIKEEVAGIPEDIKAAGDALGWLEEKYGQLPKWFTHGVDVLVPGSIQDAYKITSGLLQGDLTLEDGWKTVSKILSTNSKLAVVCQTINYTFDKGLAREAEMNAELAEQIAQGDILGAIFDGAEGFTDCIIGGAIEVLGDVGGGMIDSAIDNIPVVKGINMIAEYGTGLLGWNDGDGYSIGGLVGHATEKISDGLDAATDFITDATDVVTDAITEGIGDCCAWFGSLW